MRHVPWFFPLRAARLAPSIPPCVFRRAAPLLFFHARDFFFLSARCFFSALSLSDLSLLLPVRRPKLPLLGLRSGRVPPLHVWQTTSSNLELALRAL